MTYLRPHNSGPAARRVRAIGILVGVVAILLIFVQWLAPQALPGLFTSMARPFWRMEFAVGSGSLDSPEALMSQNEDLKRQLTDAQAQLASASALESENQELKGLLGRASSTPYVLAAVLSRPPLARYDSLIIDIGDDRGVAVNDNVFAPGNVLIGKVSQVLGETSKVTLYSSPNQRYEVLIGPSHAPATATGRGGGQYQADMPRGASVAEGDVVSSPSLNDRAFGIVTAVLSDPAQAFETVLFAPPVNVYQLRWVLVDVASTTKIKK